MPSSLLAHYPLEPTRFDEMLSEPLTPRAHWSALFETLVQAPPEQMRERLRYVQSQIRENGVTYNVYADPQGVDRPWELDPLPLIIASEEWAQIEAAIVQRATLLNRVLADVYGEQQLLREGLLPHALIYGHSGFLRPCHGVHPAGDVHLHIYAADLARSPDGRWWVIADRTQAPSGAGYALENRLITSRVFPELFRDLKVQHLASFFATLRDSLVHFAPRDDEPPLIVVLTPGPYNETYFEHAYLARYLGFPLVEGSDLLTRDGCVWLRTLSGLKRVHAIVRRLDDDFCDPLELRSDSALGVPGLLDVARRGNVLIANSLGANLLESGALLGFLPALSERLLGEPLAMPSLATWWCGEPAALEDAIEKLDHLIIKPAFPQLRFEALFGQDLSPAARADLIRRMRARPHHFVAQELLKLSQMPVWDRQHSRRLLPRATGLRVFACASPDGYVVMPGGLTRVASRRDARVIAMQRGGASKDTWVLTGGAVNTLSLLRRQIGPQDLVRVGSNLSSRVVENLFWFGRYAERCDNTARLLRLALGRMIDNPSGARSAELESILSFCHSMGLLGPAERPVQLQREIERTLVQSAIDPEVGRGLAGNLRQLVRVAFSLRERLSQDNWRTINQHAQDIAQRGLRGSLAELLAALDRAVMGMMTLSGFALDGMTRDQGWRFLSIGRRIERMQFICAAIHHGIGRADETAGTSELDWLLELADSIVTYRSRYMTRPEWLPVLDLLVLDESNPRSVAYQALGLRDYLGRLAETHQVPAVLPFEKGLAALFALRPEHDLEPCSPRLGEMLDTLSTAAFALSEQLSLHFFSHVGQTGQTTRVR